MSNPISPRWLRLELLPRSSPISILLEEKVHSSETLLNHCLIYSLKHGISLSNGIKFLYNIGMDSEQGRLEEPRFG